MSRHSEALEHFKAIVKYCRENDCKNCVFYSEHTACIFDSMPMGYPAKCKFTGFKKRVTKLEREEHHEQTRRSI